MVNHGEQKFKRFDHGQPWTTKVDNGQPFGNGQRWSAMVRTMTLSWYIMVDHELTG